MINKLKSFLFQSLSAADIEQLNRFPCGGYSDESTIVYLQHPCIILSALEVTRQGFHSNFHNSNVDLLVIFQVLGYRVVASSSTAVKQDYNEYMWTMRKEFNEPDPFYSETSSAIIERDNLANSGREDGLTCNKIDVPE